ncbi:Nn.00g064380.m01.CDS01 [Neocucurbitaria sp. VM-36]
MVDSGTDYSFFDEAIEAVQATVLEEHRRDFHSHTNASLFLDELRTTSASNGASNRGLAECCRKFGLFSRVFAPYFDILSVCVHIRPEWVGSFWGIVRLVFKAGSDFPILLEKIADMLEAVAHILPPYQHILETCERNTFSLETRTEDPRLAMLLSYVYMDLVQIFLDLYRIFCRGSQGLRLRHLTLDSTQSALWRPLDSRFSRLEARLVHHRRWLEKETENQIQNYNEIAQHRSRYLSFLNHQQGLNGNNGGELEGQRLTRRLRRVEKVKLWLSNCPSLFEAPDSGPRQRSLNSCAWFLEMPAYRKWKNDSFEKGKANDITELENTWQHRVLFVQADPGFGKTVISNTVIDHLVAEAEYLDIDDEPPSTAFFHIVHHRPESGNPDDLFRALACQLMHAHRHDRSTLDAVCLLMRKTSFREMATSDEVLDVLSLLLRQHPTFLVIDGIDGSSDAEALLASLARVCRRSDAKVILFSRPNIRIPLEYQKWASDAPHIVPLTAEHNVSVMEHFVAQILNRMADRGFFGISLDRTLMPQVAKIAKGEFLWASMLLKFLQSTVLSSDERRAILENIQALEGLESLYRNILGVLERRPKREKRIIADVFRWLSFPINQLCPSALRAALSTFDVSTSEDSCLADVLETLPELSCGLIDVEDTTITFAHESIREYLQSHLSQDSYFSLYDETSAHAHLASRCLSYLAHDVPKRPLGGLSPRIRPVLPTVPTGSGVSLRTSKSGDSGYKSRSSSDGGNHLIQPTVHNHYNDAGTQNIRVIPFDTNFPFLRYAALCWPIHLSRALADSTTHSHFPTSHEPYATVPYLPALSAFLTSRLAITAWVEASFRYSLPPTLTRLVGPLSDLKGEISPATAEGKELRLVVSKLRELSEWLVELKREHVEIMRENPSLIWQIDGDYWPVWEHIRE